MTMFYSFTNLLKAATITSSGSTNPNYPVTNLATPEAPFRPWKRVNTGQAALLIDFGTAKRLDLIMLVATNFASCNIQGNATDTWGAPSYNQTVTIKRNPFNERFQHTHLPITAGFNYQFLRILIPVQAVLDGAVGWRLGGVFAGTVVKPPKNFRAEFSVMKRDPHVDIGPEHGGWRQRLTLGDPSVAFSTVRSAKVTRLTPGMGDEWETWLNIDRQARIADIFALFFNAGDSTQGYVMRQLNDVEWSRDRQRLVTSPYEIEEVIR